MEFILIAIIAIFVLEYTKVLDSKKFLGEVEPYFQFLMEDDYKFLLNVRYGKDIDVRKKFNERLKNAALVFVLGLFILFFYEVTFVSIIVLVIVVFIAFKMPYMQLNSYYKANLNYVDQMLPYYLKSLEILIQHYTVPVALIKSIDSAPEIFKDGLIKMSERIEEGDMTIDPYMDFAKQYPVRDSMRMMRLLYRLSLGSQENKQEQLIMFSKNVSTLQNKAREQKYKARLEHMEKQTMVMLFCTGGGILALLMVAMLQMMSI